MATVNEIFNKAKDHLRAIAGDAMAISVKENKKLLDKLDELHKERGQLMVESKGESKEQQKAILSQIKDVEEAIKNQEVAETVTIKNPEAITGDLKTGLEDIITTLKEEVRNFDKEVVVKNDLGQLATLFKSSNDRKEVVKVLKAVKDSVDSIEMPKIPDTTELIVRLIEVAEGKNNENMENILKDIREKEFFLPPVLSVDLDPNLIENDRVKVTLPKEELAKMGGVIASNSNKSVKITDNDGNTTKVNSDGQLHVVMEGKVDTGNSTTANLNTDEVFTGEACNILAYGAITILVESDQNGTMVVQFGPDGVDWHDGETYTILAGAEKFFTPPVQSAYYRIKYTNGSVATTDFHIDSVLKKQAIKFSSHNIDEAIVGEDDAELVKAVLTGEDQDNDGTFVNVKTTTDGSLTISDNSNGLSIAAGNVTGTTFIHKFGNAPDFDASDGEITIWDAAEDAHTWQNMVYDYSTTADIDSISSEDAGDTVDITIQGLDSNYNIVNQTVTLNGQTRVALSTSLIRVFRAFNEDSTDLAGHVFVYVNGAITGGIPDDASTIRGVIHPENNQTEMAVYTVPAGKTGYLRSWYAATSGANKTSNYVIRLKARDFGKTFRLKHKSSIGDNGTSYIQHKYIEPEVFSEKTDIEMTTLMTAAGGTAASVSAGFDLVLIDN